MSTIDTSLGELITAIYEEYLALYRDEDLASVATAATINDMLQDRERGVEAQAA